MLYVSITFDYELFMGKNKFPLNEVLIEPTYQLLEMLDKNNTKATFFADVCCPEFFRKNGQELEFCDKMEEQMQFMIKGNHDVQLHIHPHWIKTEYDEKSRELSFDGTYYRIGNFGFDENAEGSVSSIVKDGINYLNNLLLPIDNDYKCIAYRAGGFAIQPEERFAKILYDNGIRIDSSVAEKQYYPADYNYYDFRFCNKVHNFYFSEKVGFDNKSSKKIDNSIFEVPIAAYDKPFIKNLISKVNPAIFDDAQRGTYMNVPNSKLKINTNKLMALGLRVKNLFCGAEIFTLDNKSYKAIYSYLKRYEKESNANKKDVFISIIGHPKGFEKTRIDNLRKLIQAINKEDNISFVTLRDVYSKINQ